MTKKYFLWLAIIIISVSFKALAQDVVSDTTNVKQAFARYFVSGIGTGTGILRDKATSPLYYSGLTTNLSLGWLKSNEKRERLFSTDITAGLLRAVYNGTSANTTYTGMNLYYHQLYRIPSISKNKWNIKVGGTVLSTLNFRVNQSFMNNALGIESINNLMLTGKATYDISRSRDKKFKFLFIKRDLPIKKMHLSGQANIGMLNLSHRPGYAYIYSTSMEGTELGSPFKDYSFSLRGFRFQTRINYTTYLKNGNAYQITYLWDAYRAKNQYEPLDLATHTIQFSLMFNNK